MKDHKCPRNFISDIVQRDWLLDEFAVTMKYTIVKKPQNTQPYKDV